MHLYVELWNARPAWLALSDGERQDYIAQVGPGIKKLKGLLDETIGEMRKELKPYKKQRTTPEAEINPPEIAATNSA